MATRQTKSTRSAKSDPLQKYRQKREFSRTPEPKPEMGRGAGWRFVVQKHDARRVHYDLRLEHNGTLKSWAITRGPSLIPGEKRLAVRTEDHPLQYLDFEGNIPKGEYGGGAMIVWDRGRWESAYDPELGLKKGHLDITLHGGRLKGRWHLVRMKPRPGEKGENWLFIKSDDAFSRAPSEPDITEEETTSAISGQTTEELAAKGELRSDHKARTEIKSAQKLALPDPQKVKGAKKGILVSFLKPSLAETASRAPSGPQWIHEIKYDGYRTQARVDGKAIQLLTRTGLDWTKRFQSIADALKELRLSSAMIDGEIVVEDDAGISSFSMLQADLSEGRQDRLRYVMFDLLYLEGFDLTKVALGDRKILLAQIAGRSEGGVLRYSEHLDGDGPTTFEHAARIGLEGIVSKRVDLPYRPGRGDHWIKTKAVLQQEFAILGYVPSTVTKGAVASLLLGYFGKDGLYYAGRVGTGFSSQLASSLRGKLEEHLGTKPSMANTMPPGSARGVRWMNLGLVAEVEFRGWSADKLVRQASFKGLREDRDVHEIVLESTPMPDEKNIPRVPYLNRLTHPERLLWPEDGITKEGLAEFYTNIADWILPHITDRVLSLVRCPSGASEKCFFAKHAWNGLGKSVSLVDVGETEPMLAIKDVEGLIELVQASVLEIHPWGSTTRNLEKPDRLIFDLDPGKGVTWDDVIAAAIDVRERLEKLNLKSFVKTSGGKGLHVVVPITPTAEWDEAKAFTKSLAEQMEKEKPQHYVAVMSKASRDGRIFVDYLRNGRGATAVSAYSTRARSQAPVSTPLEWDELSGNIRADHFRIGNLLQRLSSLRKDPWEGFFSLRQKIPSGKAQRSA